MLRIRKREFLFGRVSWNQPLILASASPRRAALLAAVGCPFEVVPARCSETLPQLWDAGELLRRNAVEKAKEVKERYPQRAVLGADTAVVIAEQVLGKPRDPQDARRMLHRLSGQSHEVFTALCYYPEAAHATAKPTLTCTQVIFHKLSDAEIETYLASGEPFDKAGAYGIQGVAGLFVKSIQGCYFNVVGLPLSELWELLNS